MKRSETFGQIKEGKLRCSKWSEFTASLAAFGDCRVRVIVEKLYSKRSDPQRKYYFAVICQ